ncbi:MarR family transcriptional regulator [Nocardia abscessus]|uniref:MarR family winged helix-turn-helix transcriptional regulator n=1 Tax=Nocardia abscessus TaxID=120957 RepID=UPI001895A850|nr:MarR family transcriptional regulator [Nocardia abscessus]MBF6339101.1 MarR family transcriptional regulator [Nocardia abscessus]
MDDIDDFDVDAFAAVIEDFNRVYIRIPVREKLPFTTLSVLDTLAHRGPMRLTDLTETEQLTQPGITQLIARLERDGLVLRRRDPGDGRAVIVHLTEAGRQVRQTRRDDRVRHLVPMVSELSPAHRRALAAALPALARLAQLERQR